MVNKTFFSLLKVGLGHNPYRFFINVPILSYIILDSFFGYLIISLTNKTITEISSSQSNTSLINICFILFLPLYSSILTIIYSKVFLQKKTYVINNLLNYLKGVFENAPNSFHEKYDINEKYDSYTSSIWGYDHVIQLLISMASSLIKILTISISLSYQDYKLGFLIILTNAIMLYIMPKINEKLEKIKKSNINYKQLYGQAYYESVINEELRINPKLSLIQEEDLNSSIIQIISNYHKREIFYKLENIISIGIKALFLFGIISLVYYQQKYNYILILILNQNIIFGFVDLYTEFKQTENSNKKHMEELFKMLEFIDNYEKENIKIETNENIGSIGKIKITDLDYKIVEKLSGRVVLHLKSDNLMFDMNSSKNIILINGKTGSGKTVLTKILSGQTDNCCKLFDGNTGDPISSFDKLSKHRIIINQKVSEEYTRNGNISMALNKLYPSVKSIEELNGFLNNFNIVDKFVENKLDSTFTDKLSGGERQRIVLSSMFWKILKVNPTYVIIDEPEKGIDEDTMNKIMDFIINNYYGTIFLITHNENLKTRYNEKIQSIIKYNNSEYTEIYQE